MGELIHRVLEIDVLRLWKLAKAERANLILDPHIMIANRQEVATSDIKDYSAWQSKDSHTSNVDKDLSCVYDEIASAKPPISTHKSRNRFHNL